MESIWGTAGSELTDEAMAATLTALGQARAPAPAAPTFMHGAEEKDTAFPTLEQAAAVAQSGGGEGAEAAAVFGAGSMWDDSSGSGGPRKVATRKAKGAKKRRSRVQGSGWAD